MLIIGIVGIILVILFNIKMANVFKNKGLKYYTRTSDALASVTYIRKLGRNFWPIYVITIFVLIFSFLFVFYDLIENFNYLFFLSLILSFFLYFYIGFLVNNIILKGELAIKGANYNKKQFGIMKKIIGIYCIGYLLLLSTYGSLISICINIYNLLFNFMLIIYISVLVFGYLIFFLFSKFELKIFIYLFHAEIYVNEELQAFVEQYYPNVKLYYFESNMTKYAQAFALGNKDKAIFISSYLSENLTFDELKAVVAHEIGHFQYKHSLKRSNYLFAGYGLSVAVNFLGLYLFNQGIFYSITILIYTYFYFFINMNKIHQKQETEADLYILKANIDKAIAISILLKLSSLNMINIKGNKSDKYLSTHPVFQKRIDNLINH